MFSNCAPEPVGYSPVGAVKLKRLKDSTEGVAAPTFTFDVVSVAAQCFRAGLPWVSLWMAGAAGFDVHLGKLVNFETLQIAIIALLQRRKRPV